MKDKVIRLVEEICDEEMKLMVSIFCKSLILMWCLNTTVGHSSVLSEGETAAACPWKYPVLPEQFDTYGDNTCEDNHGALLGGETGDQVGDWEP